ncbi:hypothetical protein B0T22DRAFT_268206 [Podospora appendiculata]|uniref:Uncharacterized protein n=1 Tax=Podospora appendiculata TaxID=314037 RepID=A0AAE0X3F3_9PEZI|nr:hypothetical protein B0T22DRAFT_268206 [Podospora appendiculata]
MNRRNTECRSEGCNNDVFFKAVEGAFIDPIERRASGIRSPPTGRGSPAQYHRFSTGSSVVSPYCKQHTCMHFLKDEACMNRKPVHDAVCAIHAKCPMQDCSQARIQYLDPSYEPVPNTLPRYFRLDFCAEHKCSVKQCTRRRATPRTAFCQAHSCQAEGCTKQSQEQRNCCEQHECKTEGCRTIVDGKYPYCALHVTCEMHNCGRARHSMPKSKEYHAFCTDHATCAVNRCKDIRIERSPFCASHTCRERDCTKSSHTGPYCNDHGCAEFNCKNTRSWAPTQKARGKFCPLHTCRGQDCQEFVESLSIFCKTHGCTKPKCHEPAIVEQLCLDHLKAQYIAQGAQNARKTSSNTSNSIGFPMRPARQRHRRGDIQNGEDHEDAEHEEEDDDDDILIPGGPAPPLFKIPRERDRDRDRDPNARPRSPRSPRSSSVESVGLKAPEFIQFPPSAPQQAAVNGIGSGLGTGQGGGGPPAAFQTHFDDGDKHDESDAWSR